MWAEFGEVPAMKIGRQWRIDEARFEEWLSHQEQSWHIPGK